MLTTAADIVVLDNGGTRIRIGHISNGALCDHFDAFSSARLCVDNAPEALLDIIRDYSHKHGLTLAAAVLGIPAVLDRTNDAIEHCNNIPQLEGKGLRQFLQDELSCRVIFEQDIMLQLLGEWRAGSGHQKASVFGVYFGTGIGVAYLLDGNPDNPLVMDIQAGHIPIMAEGRRCKCGNTDCIEAYACGHTLTELAAHTGCPVEQLFELRLHPHWQDKLDEQLSKFILYQAYMLATVCTMFTPEVIVIGGGIPLMAQYPREELVTKTMEHLQKPYPANSVRFEWAVLGNSAPLHGALALLELQDKQV